MHQEKVEARLTPALAGAREEQRGSPEQLLDLLIELDLPTRDVYLPESGETTNLCRTFARAGRLEAGRKQGVRIVRHDGLHNLGVVGLAQNRKEGVAC